MTFVYFVLIFGLVVIAHEFGHFLLAKVNGIRVNEFAIGMGPKLLHFKKGETEYCLRLLPIGGACVFDGEDDLGGSKDKTYDEGAFPAAGVWARISTVVAGPLFNFILGFLLAMVLFSGIRSRIDESEVPKNFRGLAVTLIAASFISLAFMGFSGIVDSIFA